MFFEPARAGLPEDMASQHLLAQGVIGGLYEPLYAQLLWLRENMRRLTVELLTAEHNSRNDTDQLSTMQHELLVGASFHLISSRVEDGQIDGLLELGPELAELAGMFEPIAA